jgi:hypothetical protein
MRELTPPPGKIATGMKHYIQPGNTVLAAAFLTVLLCSSAVFGQDAARARESKGMPPRATPADYQAHAQAGTVTIAAEFDGHSVPDTQSALTTEDYVVVEVALFGPPDAHPTLSIQDFSLRVNGKKAALPAQGYAAVFKSLKDPEWVPPGPPPEAKSKGGINTGGQGQADSGPPPVVHIPIAVERAMQQRVQKSALPEGDRPLPQAGLIFFEYHGKASSAELIYSGPAGKATLALRP